MFAVGSHTAIIWFGGLGLRLRVSVHVGVKARSSVMDMVTVSKLLGPD